MERIKLTTGRIASFTCPTDKQQAFLRDTESPGLGVRATAGSKAFIFQAKFNGETLRMTIGSVNARTLDDARKEARRLRALVDQGRDPREVKKERTAADVASREKARQEQTPALEAWNEYIRVRTPRWSERHKIDHEAMAREGGEPISRGRRPTMGNTKEAGILRPLLELPLSEITRDRVADWVDRESPRRPTRTRLALSVLGTFLRWCADQSQYRGSVDPDACARMKRDLPKAQARDDCLQREQLAAWFKAVRSLQNPVLAAYLQALLLTGARREEMASLQWDDVDLTWNRMTIRDKVEGERSIPLTPYVKALLLELRQYGTRVLSLRPKDKSKDESVMRPWVFFSETSSSGRIQEPRIAHNRAVNAAGLPPLSIHGLRRSFGTLCEWVECPTGISAQIMGHKPSATAEKHYRRRPLDLLRMWHTRIEAWILEQAGIEQPQGTTAKPQLQVVKGNA